MPGTHNQTWRSHFWGNHGTVSVVKLPRFAIEKTGLSVTEYLPYPFTEHRRETISMPGAFDFLSTTGIAMNENEYAGFWIRALAAVIDTVLVMIIVVPVLIFVFGKDYWYGGDPGNSTLGVVISYVLPAIAVIVFWIYRSATPGKMVTNISIVDAETGGKPSTGQFIGRYLGYYVSTIPLFLGIIWVAFDKRKQGWHDKLAGTVVIRNKPVK